MNTNREERGTTVDKGYVYLKKRNAIATLVLNRPEKRNVLNYEMWCAIPELVRQAEEDDEVKVLIVRGADESAFSAGADVGEFSTLRSTAEGERIYNEAVVRAEAALYQFSKPAIAMIQRYCIGGGSLLALACDMRFCSESGVFAITPAKLGIVYAFSGTKKLVDLAGASRAKDILFSGRELDAREAYEFGLVDRVYPDKEILAKTYEYAEMLTRRSMRSIKGAKKVIQAILDGASEETDEISRLVSGSYESEDYKEGVRAFLEKRLPNFREV